MILTCPAAVVTSADTTHNSVTWDAIAGATAYEIYARPAPGEEMLAKTTTSTSASIAKNQTDVEYRVIATAFGADPSPGCDWKTADRAPLPCPTDVTAVRKDGYYDTLTWTAVAGAVTYEFRVHDSADPTADGTYRGSTTTTPKDVGKAPGKPYYKVLAVATGRTTSVGCGYVQGPAPDPLAPVHGDARPATAPYAAGNGVLTCPHVTVTVTYLGWDPTRNAGAGDHRYRIYHKFTSVPGALFYWTGRPGATTTKVYPVRSNGTKEAGGYTTSFDYTTFGMSSDWFHYTPHAYDFTGNKNSAGCSPIALKLPRTINGIVTVDSTTSS